MDHFLEGRLRLIQSEEGYRFSIDAILLSGFATVREGDVVVDLGTGCGIILLCLLVTRPVGRACGLEIQEELVSQAKRNALLNGFGDSMQVVRGDIRNPPITPGSAHLVVCNPPYRKVRSGRLNPDPRKAVARHEILASIDDVLKAGRGILRKRGRMALVYPAVRLTDILARLRRFGLEPKRIRLNYPDLRTGAKLVLIEGCLGGRPGIEVLPPLLGQGDFSILNRP